MKYPIALLLAFFVLSAQAEMPWAVALDGEQRSEANKARDAYRHPRATLEFFGIKEGMTVLEISPGGGWYTEILAPLTQEKGTLYAAHYALNGSDAYYRNSLGKFLQKMAATPALYDQLIITQLQPPSELTAAPEGTVDLALAFRNVHSWLEAGTAEQTLAAIYSALKPGGVLGLVQHRAKPDTSVEDMVESGYVTEKQVLALASKAGFKLLDSSDINANQADTASHPEGVWTLPPALYLGEVDREKYLAVGESDRMTMKFVKPR
ncbi:MAG: methyltransferase [Halioglobus sp.]